MSTAQEIYEAGRDAAYARIGERHGYSGLVAGVSAVLASQGVQASGDELAGDFHSQFVGMANSADKIAVEQIARSFDGDFMRFGPLPYEVENVGRFSPPYEYGGIDVGWISSEIAKKLRADKIRRGTKKYKEFVAKNARRVVDAVRDGVREKAAATAARNHRWAEEHRADVEKVERWVKRLDRVEEILLGLTRAAGIEPRSLDAIRARRREYQKALEYMRSVLRRAEEPVEVDESTVEYAFENPEIKPFAEAAGLVNHGNKAAAHYVLSTGRRAKNRATAHRATRTRAHLGASVRKMSGNLKPLGASEKERLSEMKGRYVLMTDGLVPHDILLVVRHKLIDAKTSMDLWKKLNPEWSTKIVDRHRDLVVRLDRGEHRNRVGGTHHRADGKTVNENGLTFSRWLAAAGGSRRAGDEAFAAWRAGEDPRRRRSA